MTDHDTTHHGTTNHGTTNHDTPAADTSAWHGTSPAARGARTPRKPHRLGLPVPVILALAAVAAVRAPLHDLGIVDEGNPLAPLLVLVPLVLWVATALWWRTPRPLLALTTVGLAYGVLLVATHQLLWTTVFGDDMPRLGGNLEGVLPPTVEAVFLRAAAVPSGLLTGTLLGVLTGAVAWALDRARRR
jgi:hypothetical protein